MVYAWHSAATLMMQQMDGKETWSASRLHCLLVLKSRPFNMAMAAVIFANVCVIVAEADIGARCDSYSDCSPLGLYLANWFFLTAYLVETGMRIYVQRDVFHTSRWNILDMAIVVAGLFDMIVVRALARSSLANGDDFPDLMLFRIARGLRMLRAFHLAQFFPQLRFMLLSLHSAMMAMAWGFGMIILVLLTLSVLLVEVIRPLEADHLENEWCQEAFSSVGSGMLFFVQTMMAGDSWGTCSIPMITRYPATSLVFIGGLVLVQLGFMNLILAAAVDAANEHHEANLEKRKAERLHEKLVSSQQLLTIMRRVDTDCSGCLDYQELLAAYDADEEMQNLLTLLDIDRDDLSKLFSYMDSDGSGEVAYEEFVRSIQKAQSRDVRMQLLALMLHISELTPVMRSFMETFSSHVMMTHTDNVTESKSQDGTASAEYVKRSKCPADQSSRVSGMRAAAGVHEIFAQIREDSQAVQQELQVQAKAAMDSMRSAAQEMLSRQQEVLRELQATPQQQHQPLAPELPRAEVNSDQVVPDPRVRDSDHGDQSPSGSFSPKVGLRKDGKSRRRHAGATSPQGKQASAATLSTVVSPTSLQQQRQQEQLEAEASPSGGHAPLRFVSASSVLPPEPSITSPPAAGRAASSATLPARLDLPSALQTAKQELNVDGLQEDPRLLQLQSDLRRAEMRMQQQEELQSSLRQIWLRSAKRPAVSPTGGQVEFTPPGRHDENARFLSVPRQLPSSPALLQQQQQQQQRQRQQRQRQSPHGAVGPVSSSSAAGLACALAATHSRSMPDLA